jgi:hypothetical protein
MTLETEIYQILKKHRLGLKKREELIVDLLDFINKREEAITVTHSCESDSEQLKHDYLEIGKQVEIDLTFTEKHIGKIVSINKDKVKVENNDWTYEVSKQNIAKVF